MDGEKLREVRSYLGLSQEEAAEMLAVSLVTYQRWEQGKARPRPYNLREIRLKFKQGFQALGLIEAEAGSADQSEQPAKQKENMPSRVLPISNTLTPSVNENTTEAKEWVTSMPMTLHFLSLADMELSTNRDKPGMVRQVLKEFDKMNTTNKNYQITRREAIGTLAALPFATLGLSLPNKIVPPEQYGKALAHCATSLEACWELSKSSEAEDLALAFQCVSRYLPILQTIVKNSSEHRQEAADLAGRYALLKTILSWHREGLTEAILYAKEATLYSEASGDVSLQLSAYSKLAWAYFYDKRYRPALETALTAQFILEQALEENIPLSPCIRGGTYSTLALMQVRSGKNPSTALGKATEIDPGNEYHAFMEFTRTDLPRETALVYSYQGNHAKAMEALGTLIDPETLSSKLTKSARGRIDVINIMALSSLRNKNRDMEQTIHFWMAVIKEAKAMRSEWGFNEALETYDLMGFIWPGEKRIAELRELTEHW
jgi:transcriptional regulator with XRE-family HTH domain